MDGGGDGMEGLLAACERRSAVLCSVMTDRLPNTDGLAGHCDTFMRALVPHQCLRSDACSSALCAGSDCLPWHGMLGREGPLACVPGLLAVFVTRA